MTDWVRLWHDMPTDPKWRTIARKSGQPLPCVIALFNLLLVNASGNADERGTLSNWDDEDAAAALDMDAEDVSAIIAAMQGKVLDGARLTGWEKRQPKREDGTAAARKAAWKERKEQERNAAERTGTQWNAPETETETETDIPLSNDNGAVEIDEDAQFWADAKSYLSRRGVKNPGGVVGMWVKAHGKPATADAITRAQLERPPEVVAFIQGCFRRSNGTSAYPAGHSGIPL